MRISPKNEPGWPHYLVDFDLIDNMSDAIGNRARTCATRIRQSVPERQSTYQFGSSSQGGQSALHFMAVTNAEPNNRRKGRERFLLDDRTIFCSSQAAVSARIGLTGGLREPFRVRFDGIEEGFGAAGQRFLARQVSS